LWLLLISLFIAIPALPAFAQEGAMPVAALDPPGEAVALVKAPSGRIGRLSLVSGNVSVRSSAEWLDAELNFPLAAGASLRTGAQARAEIEIGADRIGLTSETEVEITKLADRALQVAVGRGRIYVWLRGLGDGDGIEVVVSGEEVPLSQPGRYDIDAPNRRVTVSADEGAQSDLDETHLGAPYFVSSRMTGLAELEAAGSWEWTAEFGNVWVPTGLPDDWAPYRNGHWRWIVPCGWTWIDDQPWGFAPSHYGRWAFAGERWVWVPGHFVEHPVYVPAVVAFLGTAHVGLSVAGRTGPAIGWFPLAPGEVYWPSYTRDLAYVRNLNLGNVTDVWAIHLDANGEAPLEVFTERFANRRFAGVVPRPVFVTGSAVAPAVLSLPEQRLLNAPVLMGSPQIGPPIRRIAVAAAAIKPSRPNTAWTNHIAALVARGISRAKALEAGIAALHAREPAIRLRGAHLRAPAYAQSAPQRRTIILRLAHAAPPPARSGTGKVLRR
jgi:hypothetical protein